MSFSFLISCLISTYTRIYLSFSFFLSIFQPEICVDVIFIQIRYRISGFQNHLSENEHQKYLKNHTIKFY